MSNDIPGGVRSMVRGREAHHCVRCGMRGAEIHHRRGKSVVDHHTHCPCNLVYLCGWGNHTGCHGWAHSNPFEARSVGLIVPRHVAVPGAVPVQYVNDGWRLLTCDGMVAAVHMAELQPPEGPITPPVDLYPTENPETP